MTSSRLLPFAALLLLSPAASTLPARAQGGARDEAARSLNPLAALDKATLSGFVEQPLFEPSRHRPVAAPRLVYVAPPPPPVVEPPPSLRLLGLVEGARSSAAVVHRNDTGKTETLRPGDRIGSWVVQIMPAALRVMSGDRTFDYALFRGGPQQGPVAAEAPPPFVAPTVAVRDPAAARAR